LAGWNVDADVTVCVAFRQVDVESLDRKPTSASHGIAGIEREVHDHLFQLPVISLDRSQPN
jgi:hypothetical protein